MSWRFYTDLAKRSDLLLRVADRLGRGKGRLRLFDYIQSPPPPAPRRPDLTGWEGNTLAACWIGHSTVLLRIGDQTILTDPVFSSRIGIGLGLATAGPRRLFAPAIPLTGLPPIDLILISHAHFDHLDRPTLRRLPKSIPVVTAHHTQDLIRDLGFNHVTELRWGESYKSNGLNILAAEVRHWGARTFYDSHRGYNAYLLDDDRHKVLYAGDTAYFSGFKNFGPVDLAVFGIGAYDPYLAAHANPEQVWTMANHVRADHIAAVHHGTFKLSHEPMTEPIERLLIAAREDSKRIVIQKIGQVWRCKLIASLVPDTATGINS